MTYPSNDFERGATLLGAIGAFWSRIYEDRDTCNDLATARGLENLQTHRNLLEAIAAVSRYEIPIYHKEEWSSITLRRSERESAQVALPIFGDGSTFGDDVTTGRRRYGVPLQVGKATYPLPTTLRSCRQLYNQLLKPTRVLTEGVDYVTANLGESAASITFRIDPFSDANILLQPVFESGEIVDETAVLWVFGGEYDWNYISDHFAYVLGLSMPSAVSSKELLNAILDAITGGTALTQVQAALTAMTGIPLVQEAEETVEAAAIDANGLFVATDQHVYRFADTATTVVGESDDVRAGDMLVDALEFYDPKDPIPDWLRSVVIDGDILDENLEELSFANAEEATTIGTDVYGNVTIRFPVYGFPLTVDRFWEIVETRGRERDETLANLLDDRPDGQQELPPSAISLPATLNPADFILKNLLRSNVLLVRLKVADIRGDAAGLEYMHLLRRIIPPHTMLRIVAEMPTLTDETGVEQEEEADSFLAAEPLIDEVDDLADGANRIYAVSGTCY